MQGKVSDLTEQRSKVVGGLRPGCRDVVSTLKVIYFTQSQ